MKYLITGGAGFIGSNYLVNSIKNKNNLYVCLDNLTYASNYKYISHLTNYPNFKFVLGNINSKRLVEDLFKTYNFDIIVNFAAESSVDKGIKHPDIFFKTNVLGTLNLLKISNKYKIKRFHQISTDEVYGPSLNSNNLFLETDKLKPSSIYATSKASADLLVLSYFHMYNLPISISRSSNNYGENQHIDKLIPKTIKLAVNNKKIPIYGNGQNIRDWLYAKDNCKAIDLIIQKGKCGEIYNISNHNNLSNIELAKKILIYLNKKEDLIKFTKDRLSHDFYYGISTSKIEKELGYQPSFDFEDSFKETIEYYVKLFNCN